MTYKTFTRFRFISITIFVIGVVSAVFAYSLREPSGPKMKHRKGYTLQTRSTAMLTIPRKPVPHEIKRSESIRYQRSDGTFKEITLYYDFNEAVVKKSVLYGVPGQGVFRLNGPGGPLDFLSAMPPGEKTSYVRDDDGHWQPNFVRDDWVHGYQTYVLRFPDDDGGYHELYFAPALDNQELRSVSVSPGGVSVSEVTEIVLGDPANRIFDDLPPFVVNYELFKSKIEIMEEAGHHDTAEAMRREMAEQIAKEMKTQ